MNKIASRVRSKSITDSRAVVACSRIGVRNRYKYVIIIFEINLIINRIMLVMMNILKET